MKIILKINLIILVSGLLSCQKDDLHQNLISTKWYLQRIQHIDTQIEDVVPKSLKGMNVVFSDSNRIHATSSCNVFDGYFYMLGSDSLSIDIGSTLIYCIDFNKRLWDSIFYYNLFNSSKYYIKHGTLSILTTKNTVMIFN